MLRPDVAQEHKRVTSIPTRIDLVSRETEELSSANISSRIQRKKEIQRESCDWSLLQWLRHFWYFCCQSFDDVNLSLFSRYKITPLPPDPDIGLSFKLRYGY